MPRFIRSLLLRCLNVVVVVTLMIQNVLPPSPPVYAYPAGSHTAAQSTALLADAVNLAINHNGADVQLNWVSVANSQSYELHRSNTPFFTPSPSTLFQTLTANTTAYTDVAAGANPAVSHFYIVRAVNGSQFTDSAEVGAISYALNNTGGNYSLLALPFSSTTLIDAAALAATIGNVASLLKWHPPTQTFRLFTPPNAGDNFPLTTGDAVFVVVNAGGPSLVTLTGNVTASQHTLTPGGYNFFSLPLQSSNLNTASALAADVTGVQSLLAWNTATQLFRLFTPPSAGDNFALQAGAPLIAQLTAGASTTWPAALPTPTATPPPTLTPTATTPPTALPTATPTATPLPTLAPVADSEGPTIDLVAPPDRQSVYTLTPAVEIHYSDNAGVNLATLQVTLNGTNVTSNLNIGPTSATGTLNVTADTSYTLQVTVQDNKGNSSTKRSTFYAPPSPTTITPPTASAHAGWVSGAVYKANTCQPDLTGCQGLAGVRITLTSINPTTVQQLRQQRAQQLSPTPNRLSSSASQAAAVGTAVNGTVVTGPDGFFAFPVATTGTYWLKAEKDGYTYGQREVYIIKDRSTATNAIYLKPLDPHVITCDTAGCSYTNSDNTIQIIIPAGAIPAGETRTINATNFEQVEFLPSGDLPAGTAETYAFNLGGASEATFVHPITVRQRNTRGFSAGQQIPLGYWNQALQAWEHAGIATVDASGQWLEMQVVHFSNYDPNMPATRPVLKASISITATNKAGRQAGGDGGGKVKQGCDKSKIDPPAHKHGCIIHLGSGIVEEEIALPPVTILGHDTAPTLAYRTTRANPNQIIDIPLSLDPEPGVVFTSHYINFELYIEGEKTDTFAIDANLQSGEIGRYRYLWDGRNAQGQLLPPGAYEYVVKLGIPYRAQYCNSINRIFGNPPDCVNAGTGVFVDDTAAVYATGTLKVDSQPASPYGSGWVIDGQQRLYQDDTGRVMIADGQRVDEFIGFARNLAAQGTTNALAAAQYTRLQSDATVLLPPNSTGTNTNPVGDQTLFLPLINAAPLEAVSAETSASAEANQAVPTVNAPTLTPAEPFMLSTALLRSPNATPYTMQQALTQTLVAGNIAANTTWTLANSPYILNGNVTVASNAVLTIEPGVVVEFPQSNLALAVNGVLVAEGTAQAPIRFRGTNATPGVYGGSLVLTGNGNSHLDHIVIEHMGEASFGPALQLETAAAIVSNSLITDSENIGVYVAGGAPTLQNNVIGRSVNGMQLQSSDAMQVTGNTFEQNTNGIYIAFASQGVFTGNTFQNNSTGVYIFENSQPVFTGNTFQNNGIDFDAFAGSVSGFGVGNNLSAIHVHGNITGNAAWPSQNIPYILNGNVNVGDNAKLTIEAGVEVQFPQPNFTLGVRGTLVAVGTAQLPIRFRGTNPTAGIYGGYLWLQAPSTNSVLDYVRLEHMGEASVSGQALVIESSSVMFSNSVVTDSENIGVFVSDCAPTLQNNLISGSVNGLQINNGGLMQVTGNTLENNTNGVYLAFANQSIFTSNTIRNNTTGVVIVSNSQPVFTTNIFQNNGSDIAAFAGSLSNFRPGNTLSAIHVSGAIVGAATWPNLGIPYVLNGNVSVADNSRLTIDPGVEVLFPQPNQFIEVRGTLLAVGTAQAPIRFHGTNPTAGVYGGYFMFQGNSVDSVLDYVTIEHMGEASVSGRTLQLSTSSIIVSNSIISDSEGVGIYVANNATPTLLRLSLLNNQVQGLQNQGPAVINAQGFWWGSSAGPYHPTLNPNGTGNQVSDYVNFKPWLTTPADAVPLTEDDYTVLRYNAADGTYTRVYPSGHQVHFNGDGTHDYTQDPDGHKLRYTYNADGSVASMTFTLAGESTPRYAWNFQYTNGKLTSITDPANQATTFTTNGLGQLTQVNFANNTHRRFLYANNGLLLQRWDEDGNSWRYNYDRFGRISQHLAPPRAVYNYATSTIEVKTEDQSFTPSQTGYPLLNDSAVGNPASPAPAAPKSAALVDKVQLGRGNLSGHTNRWGAWSDLTDAIGRTSTFVRDEASRITQRSEPNGDCIEFSYDARGNPLHSTRMAAAQCALTASARNPAALQTSAYTYEERFNQLKTETDPLGNTTTYIYDYETGVSQAGRLVRINYPTVQDANGASVTPNVRYTYNALGLLESLTDQAGIVTRYTYNAAGQLTQQTDNQGGLNLVTTFQDFDAAGRPQTVIDPRNNTSHYTYDLWGRLLTETDPLGVVTKYEYDQRGNVIRTTLDYTADGVTGRNLITTASYDADNRLLTQQTVADNLTQSASNVYDINGNLATSTNSEGQTVHFTYDDANQLTSVADPLSQTTRFTYTVKGELAQITQANSKVTAFNYDAFGNLASLTPPDRPAHQFSYSLRNEAIAYTPPSVGSGAPQTTYAYNALGQLTSFTRPDNQTATYKYDSAQRLASVTQPRGATTYSYNATTSQLTAIAAPQSINLSYGYDNELLTGVTWSGPINGSVNYSYDNFYRLTALAVNGVNPIAYQYDNNSFVTQAGALTLNRLRQSRLLNNTSLGQVTDAYEYDAFGKLTHYQASANGAPIYDLRYTYDALNRIATRSETLSGSTTLYAYTYDAVGRLIEVKANGATTATYSYDGNGNRLTGPGGATGTYDNQDRLLSYGGNSYTYTANGELLTKTNNGQTTTYNYDPFSNLLAVTLPTGTQIDYLVDGQDRRIGKKVNGTLVQGFLYQGQLEPVAELDGSGNVVSRFVYASRAHVPDFMIKGGVTYRIVSDHLGSVQFVVNTQTGQIVQQMNYDEFGNVIQDSNPGFQPFGFAGGLYDRDTGLVRFGARDYDSNSGRWTTKDPVGFLSGDTNLYVYVGNDPVNVTDLTGTVIDTVLDAGFIIYDLYRLGKDNVFGNCNNLGENLAALGADAIGAAIPGLTGAGVALRAARAAKAAEKLADAAKVVDRIENAQTTTRFINSAKVELQGKVVFEGTVDLKPTLDRIKAGETYPHRNDGAIFENREGLLPDKPTGYYQEYVHPTSGISGAGPQRVVTGKGGEIYYTPNHYGTFVPLN